MSLRSDIAVVILGTGLVACAAYPKPVERLASAEASVRAAREVDAAASPNGALYLKYAEESLAEGRTRMASGENARAEATLIRAAADAELALAIARETAAREQAISSLEQLRRLERRER